MIGLGIWQDLLKGLGAVLAWLYSIVPSYAVSIIVLTIFIRLLLLPLGIKQIRSMHAMSALAPKVKALQTKYKGNRTKQQEEIQKLYQEHGVNPLGGCLPMLLQIPVLIALYSVLRFPANVGGHEAEVRPPPQSHIPVTSNLYDAIIHQSGDVRWLLCSAGQAGGGEVKTSTTGSTKSQLVGAKGEPISNLDCGKGIPVRIPYYVLALFMVLTTYYQSRQMQRASPTQSQQQQTLTRVMPLLFGVWGFLFPAGLVVYWTTSNLWQIGQQHFVIKARERDEEAVAQGRKPTPGPKRRGGFMTNMMQRAQQERQRRGGSADDAGRGARSEKPSSGGQSGRTGSRKAAPDPNRPRSYRPSATSSGDGRGRTAPKGTRSPLGVAGEDGNVQPGTPEAGQAGSGGTSQKGSPGSGQRARSGQGGQGSQGSQRSGSRSSGGSRKKRRKR